MVPVRFRPVPGGYGRFRVGSSFYIHPIIRKYMSIDVSLSFTARNGFTGITAYARPCNSNCVFIHVDE